LPNITVINFQQRENVTVTVVSTIAAINQDVSSGRFKMFTVKCRLLTKSELTKHREIIHCLYWGSF
jgi:hypothetical protein